MKFFLADPLSSSRLDGKAQIDQLQVFPQMLCRIEVFAVSVVIMASQLQDFTQVSYPVLAQIERGPMHAPRMAL